MSESTQMLVTMTKAQLRDLVQEAVDAAVERVLDRPDRPMLTAREVGEYLSVGSTTVAKMLKAGELPGVRIRGQWRVRREQLFRWLEEHRGKAA
jgi:excisionase family DNA binding protein